MPPLAAGMQLTGQLAVRELGDVSVAQVFQRHIAKFAHKQRVSLQRHGFEFTTECGWVFSHVVAIRIRKPWLGLLLLASEVPGNQLGQKLLIESNVVVANFPPWKDQQFIVGRSGNKLRHSWEIRLLKL
jgi:hypothetical protein